MSKWIVETVQEGGRWIARVKEPHGSYDQREGQAYRTVAIALGNDEQDALESAVAEAFFKP